MINPTIHVNKVFRDQDVNFLKDTFHQSNMKGLKTFMRKKYTWVIALVIFNETKTKKSRKSV